jgi:hypothetical protein
MIVASESVTRRTARRIVLLLTLWFPVAPMMSAVSLMGAGASGHAVALGWHDGRTMLVLHHVDDAAPSDAEHHHHLVDRLLLSTADHHDHGDDHAVSLTDTQQVSRPDRSLSIGPDVIIPTLMATGAAEPSLSSIVVAPCRPPATSAPPRTTRLQI